MDQFLKLKMSMIHVKFGRGQLPGPKFSGCFSRTIPIALSVEQYLEEV